MSNPNKPLFYIALVISLAIIVFLGWYGYNQQVQQARDEQDAKFINEISSDPTANWKIYRNEEYGFEFKYPTHLEVKDNLQADGISFVDPDYEGPPVFTFYPYFLDKTFTGSKQEILLSVVKDDLKNNFLKLKRYNGDEIIVESEDIFGIHSYFVNQNTKVAINIVGRDTIDTKLEFYDQILSTFKFISTSTNVVNTSDWKIYKNSKLEIEFKYPQLFDLKEDPNNIVIYHPDSMADINAGSVETPPDITVNLVSSSTKVSLIQFIQAYNKGWYANYKIKNNKVINSNEFIITDDSSSELSHFPVKAAFVKIGNNIYLITLNWIETSQKSDLVSTFDGLLSTFKFTN